MLKRIIRSISIAFICLGMGQNWADEPIEIQSDSAVFDDEKGTATYTGHAVMTQGDRHLTSHVLIIFRDAEGKVESMMATGTPAAFHAQLDINKPITHGEAKSIHYFPKQDKLLLLENAIVTQNKDAIQGDRLTYSLSTHLLDSEPVTGKQTTIILAPKE